MNMNTNLIGLIRFHYNSLLWIKNLLSRPIFFNKIYMKKSYKSALKQGLLEI